MMGVSPVTLFVVALSLVTILADPIDSLSFGAPFTDVKPNGDRFIPGWVVGGHAFVKDNFVRLTPDRQSKQGWLWSANKIDSEQLSTVMKFRISGQGAKLFGDGIGLWITKHDRRVEGSLHGMTDQFTGIAIILDTFKNSETAGAHKDVTVLINDGTKDVAAMLQEPIGCDASFRYHESRADFSVTNAARLRVALRNDNLKVYIDESNDGNFQLCTEVKKVNLPKGWLKQASIGVMATTGGLADNHDILSLTTFGSVAEGDDEQLKVAATDEKKPVGRAINSERFNEMSRQIEEMQESGETLRHHLEHQLTAVHDGLSNTIGKLQGQESEAEKRIEELERRMGQQVASTLESRIQALEEMMTEKIDKKLNTRVSALERAVDKKISREVEDGVSKQGGTWKTPFALLVVVLVAVAVALYQWYQKLRKTHLL